MTQQTKIATLNLCLGLKNKKEEIKRIVEDNKIDILCVQETEVIKDYPIELLTFRNFNYENEMNDLKSRCGIYVRNNVSYVRRTDLEVKNMHIVIIDINNTKKHRIITIYRPFNPQITISQKEFFEQQLQILKANITPNTLVLGDFNLDQRKNFDPQYGHKLYFESLRNAFEQHGLIQAVTFDTWSRVINNVVKSSIIDHIYLKDPTEITNISSITPPFGDHILITFEINIKKIIENQTWKRNWKLYSKENLIRKLSTENWEIKKDSVQSYWNEFESKLVEIIDELAPFQPQKQIEQDRAKPPPSVKNKINKRNRLLKKLNLNPQNIEVRSVIKQLNKDIKVFFFKQKQTQVRRGILPGNSKSLWDSVKIAKGVNIPSLPDNMSLNDNLIKNNDLPEAFANFFENKITQITSNTQISNNVYNGTKKVDHPNSFFMTDTDIRECLNNIKI